MANKKIYGCYNSSTGAITFAGEACDSGDYAGCFVTSGEHAGQIAVTVKEYSCDDIYYGCIDPTTGNFEVEIPDDCCAEFGEDCNYCESDSTPKYIGLEFVGVSIGTGCEEVCLSTKITSPSLNDSFLLEQTVGNYCTWGYYDSDACMTYFLCAGANCTSCWELAGELTLQVIKLTANSMRVTATGGSAGLPAKFFYAEVATTSDCIDNTILDNDYDDYDCATRKWGKGGTVHVIPFG